MTGFHVDVTFCTNEGHANIAFLVSFENSMPKILLIPDKFTWIMGTIAKNIVRYNPELAFAYATIDQVDRQPGQVVSLSRQVDLIHWILDLEYFHNLPRELADFPGQIASVHHVLEWDLAQRCRTAKFIHIVSTEWRDYLIERGIPAEKIVMIPNGVDPVRFNPSLSQIDARRRFGIPASAFVVGFFGSAHVPSRPRKGVDVFIQAALQLKQRIPDLCLFISGQNWETDVAAMRQTGLNVFCPGFLPARQLPAAYRTLDTFVVASTIEGGPVTALESMASGVPLISTSVGMVRDAVQDREQALIIPSDQPAALAEAIEMLYSDSNLISHLKENALALVRERYLWEHVAPLYGDLYRKALADRPQSSTYADPFVRQRQFLLQRDMAAFMASTWNKNHRREAFRLLEDVPGLGQKVLVLWFCGILGLRKLTDLINRKLQLSLVKSGLKH
jgi:glycosyltransferase involved in cell wall biosynthesis